MREDSANRKFVRRSLAAQGPPGSGVPPSVSVPLCSRTWNRALARVLRVYSAPFPAQVICSGSEAVIFDTVSLLSRIRMRARARQGARQKLTPLRPSSHGPKTPRAPPEWRGPWGSVWEAHLCQLGAGGRRPRSAKKQRVRRRPFPAPGSFPGPGKRRSWGPGWYSRQNRPPRWSEPGPRCRSV